MRRQALKLIHLLTRSGRIVCRRRHVNNPQLLLYCTLPPGPWQGALRPAKAAPRMTFACYQIAPSLSTTMGPNSPQGSHTTTTLFFALISIAFLPGIFHYLWTLPLSLIIPPPSATADIKMGSWFQKQFTLPSQSRGSYLITNDVVSSLPELKQYKVGLLNLFIQHTSCALSLNENWDDDVRADMSDALDRIAPEEGPKGEELYRHSAGKRYIYALCRRPSGRVVTSDILWATLI